MRKASKVPAYHAPNERAKYRYRIHLARASGMDEKTVISILKHIRDFEIFTRFADFKTFNDSRADRYIRAMSDSQKSLSYMQDNIRALREFLRWLERQKGYRSKIDYNHIDYLNLTRNQRKEAKTMDYKQSYAYEQILTTIRQMPDGTITEQRDKAIVSLQALCGLRAGELRTVKLKNLIEEDGRFFIYVNPKDMDVKFAKTRHANFMPLPEDVVQNVIGWRDTLLQRGFCKKDPLFPRIDSRFGQTSLLHTTLSHDSIKSGSTIREIFKKAFEAAGYGYLRPHSFRHTIARFAAKQTPEFLNAVRQSLGHESIDTTFSSYGTLSTDEQRRRIGEVKLDFAK